MKWLLGYLAFGLLLTVAWNVQVQATCGKPMAFTGLVLAPIFIPIFAPVVIWNNTKPACEKMNLALSSTDGKSL